MSTVDMNAVERARQVSEAIPSLPARPIPQVLPDTKPRVSPAVRVFEIVFGATALILFSPVILLEAIIICLGTPGRALFFQTRLGVDCRPFRFVKFRTLYADAKQRFPELYSYRYSEEEIAQLKFKIYPDPRVTPQGRWLRQTSLDELPNFWNVLTGDMALVGPRPEIPEMLPYYHGWMLEKFNVRPGITGLAQISGRGRLSFHDTVKLDVDYARTRTIWLDLKILLKTVMLILIKDGAF
jgi:lipopolysaccharide/colanic/teichoic acid biosynthesis glycosyltransferase